MFSPLMFLAGLSGGQPTLVNVLAAPLVIASGQSGADSSEHDSLLPRPSPFLDQVAAIAQSVKPALSSGSPKETHFGLRGFKVVKVIETSPHLRILYLSTEQPPFAPIGGEVKVSVNPRVTILDDRTQPIRAMTVQAVYDSSNVAPTIEQVIAAFRLKWSYDPTAKEYSPDAGATFHLSNGDTLYALVNRQSRRLALLTLKVVEN